MNTVEKSAPVSQEDVLKNVLLALERNNRLIFYHNLFTAIKIVLVIVPLLLALIYIPPFLKEVFSVYQEVIPYVPTVQPQ